jgi:hypothetical protein
MKNFIPKLKFKKSNLKFDDGSKLLEASLSGKFDRSHILTELNKLSEGLKDGNKSIQLGVAIHYHNVNDWGPALMRSTNVPMELWNPSDSPDTVEAYRNDYIDSIHVFIVEHNADVEHVSHRTPKKSKFGEVSRH